MLCTPALSHWLSSEICLRTLNVLFLLCGAKGTPFLLHALASRGYTERYLLGLTVTTKKAHGNTEHASLVHRLDWDRTCTEWRLDCREQVNQNAN